MLDIYTLLLPTLHHLAVPSTSPHCPDSPFQPIVVAAITAANTLLLLASLATFIGSCTVLKRVKQGRQIQDKSNLPEDDDHIYEAVDDEAKGQTVKAEGDDTVPVYADVTDLLPSIRRQYQTPQMHSRDKP